VLHTNVHKNGHCPSRPPAEALFLLADKNLLRAIITEESCPR